MKKFKKQAGFTLAEILVALALIFTAVFTITPLMENSMNNIIKAEEKRQGIGEAQSEIDSTMAEGVVTTDDDKLPLVFEQGEKKVNVEVVGKEIRGEGQDETQLESFISREKNKTGKPKMHLEPSFVYEDYPKNTEITVYADEYMSFDEYYNIGLYEKDKTSQITGINFNPISAKQKKIVLTTQNKLKAKNSPYYVIAKNAKNDTVEAELSVIKKPNFEPEFMIGGKMTSNCIFQYQELDKDGKWGKTQSSNIQSGINFFGMSRDKNGKIQWKPIPFEDSDELKKANITEINNIAWDGEHYVAATNGGLFYRNDGSWKMIDKNKQFPVNSIGRAEKSFQVTNSKFVLNCSKVDGKSYFGAGNALFTLDSTTGDVKGVVYGNGECTCATEFTYKGKNYLLVCFSKNSTSADTVAYSQIIFIDTETDGIASELYSYKKYEKISNNENNVGHVINGIVWDRNKETPGFIAVGQINSKTNAKNGSLYNSYNNKKSFISKIQFNANTKIENNKIIKAFSLGANGSDDTDLFLNMLEMKDPVICFGYDNLGQGVYFFDTSLRTFQLTQNELNNLNNNEIQQRIDYIDTNLFGGQTNKDIVYVEKIINAPGDIDNKFVAVASERKGPRVLEFKGINDLVDNKGNSTLDRCRIEGSPGVDGSLPSNFQPQAVAGMVVE